LALFAICLLLFSVWPGIDIYVSAAFYENGAFAGQGNAIVKASYHFFAVLPVLCLVVLVSGLALSFRKPRLRLRSTCVFMLICLFLVPGLAIDKGIKDNSTGRSRPRNIETFGGDAHFSGPFQYAGTCSRNCSFVSGHAANGFFLMSPFWAIGGRRWLVFGILAGSLAGVGRILQGAHFLSDVVFAGWVSYFLYGLIAMLRGILQRKS
jgi:lipid A 4'-phosphatase